MSDNISEIIFDDGESYERFMGVWSRKVGAQFIDWIKFSKSLTSISLSKWPILQTIASFFIASMCFLLITDLFPVAVTKMSALSAAYSMVTTL